MRFTLPKSLFFKEADYHSLFKTGKKKFGSFFVVYSKIIDSPDITTHIGMAVSKKSSGPSNRRNLIKRLIREKFRLNQHELQHLQILVVTNREIKAKKPDRKALQADLDRLFTPLLNSK